VVDISHQLPARISILSPEILCFQCLLSGDSIAVIRIGERSKMDRFAILFAALGLICIYAGYKLFCGLPAMNGGKSRANWLTVFLINVVPGALLALVGTGLLMGQVRSVFSHPASIRGHQPAEGTTWHRAYSGLRARTA